MKIDDRISGLVEVLLILTLYVALGTLAQADGQVGDAQVGGRAGQAGVLAGSGAGLAGLVARPAGAVLAGEAARRTAAHARTARQNRHNTVNTPLSHKVDQFREKTNRRLLF